MTAVADGGVEAAKHELTIVKAALLGIIEGITEYLPISSTGHLLVAERLFNVGQNPATKDAADTYTITIQAGAILAVLVLYHARLMSMVRGVARPRHCGTPGFGRDDRRLHSRRDHGRAVGEGDQEPALRGVAGDRRVGRRRGRDPRVLAPVLRRGSRHRRAARTDHRAHGGDHRRRRSASRCGRAPAAAW